MTVVVNAAATRIGGGITYLERVIPPLSWELRARGEDLVVLTGRTTAERLSVDQAAPGTRIQTARWMEWPGMVRVLAEQLLVPLMLRRCRASVVFGVSDTLPLFTKVPCVLLCRNALIPDTSNRSARHRALRLLSRRSLRKAEIVVAVSGVLSRAVAPYVEEDQVVEVVHHGPGSEPSATSDETAGAGCDLLWVGSLYPHKRLELAIEAIEILVRDWPDVRLTVVGRALEPNYEQFVHEQVDARNLSTRVTFMGELRAPELEKLYRAAQALLITSRVESFCHPILEAFSAHLPLVICQDLEVAQEIAGDAAMFVAPSGDGVAIAAGRILRGGYDVDALVAAGVDQLERFDWKTTARRTADLLERAVSQPRRGRS